MMTSEMISPKMITKDWKVSKVLEEYPQTLEIFVAATPHFKKLRNPLLRKALASRVTVLQAAKIGGVDVDELLKNLNAAVGLEYVPQNDTPANETQELQDEFESVNQAIIETIASEEVVLDVRPIISSGSDPLKTILQTVRGLREGQALHLINSFEPIPLYSVLGDKGFQHFTRNVMGVWHVWFFRSNDGTNSLSREAGSRTTEQQADSSKSTEPVEAEERIIELDVRGLAPPEPMMKILEKLPEVDARTILLVHHHREPMLLYEKLERRGYQAVTEKVGEEYYKVVIRKQGR
ncbi:MAG TPA: DUF2249 domain-containing protein [Bacteroidota bacterium]|nr:DUF2249 domain-containing protein [Bacteroidota bacterium]